MPLAEWSKPMSHNHASPPRCSLQSWCDPSTGTQAPNALWGTWTGGAADRGTCTQIALTTQARARAVCPLLDRRRAERRNPPGLADGGCVSPHRPSPDLRSRRLIELDAGPCPRASIPRAGKKKKNHDGINKKIEKKRKKKKTAPHESRAGPRAHWLPDMHRSCPPPCGRVRAGPGANGRARRPAKTRGADESIGRRVSPTVVADLAACFMPLCLCPLSVSSFVHIRTSWHTLRIREVVSHISQGSADVGTK